MRGCFLPSAHRRQHLQPGEHLSERIGKLDTKHIDLALSSYWSSGRNGRPLDLFLTGTDLGLSRFELSGIHGDTFFEEVRPGDFQIMSVHDPAPPAKGEARMGCKELRQADLVLTSLDAERRRQAITITKRTIMVAAEYGAQAVVLHPGQSNAEPELARRLENLYLAGAIAGPEAVSIRARLIAGRAEQHTEHMHALRRSLDELIPFAEVNKIRLGVENRPGHEIPTWTEMGNILSWYPHAAIGYWHDTGHAETQARLGWTPHVEWLSAFGSRLVGMHLHDMVGLDVHRAPGSGEIDWASLLPYLPKDGLRVLEIDKNVAASGLQAGIQFLCSQGWIRILDH
jgi:sugar phosphate isomerase/epimerase